MALSISFIINLGYISTSNNQENTEFLSRDTNNFPNSADNNFELLNNFTLGISDIEQICSTELIFNLTGNGLHQLFILLRVQNGSNPTDLLLLMFDYDKPNLVLVDSFFIHNSTGRTEGQYLKIFDIDQDGIKEIVFTGVVNDYAWCFLYVFNATSTKLNQEWNYWWYLPYAINRVQYNNFRFADFDNDGTKELMTVCSVESSWEAQQNTFQFWTIGTNKLQLENSYTFETGNRENWGPSFMDNLEIYNIDGDAYIEIFIYMKYGSSGTDDNTYLYCLEYTGSALNSVTNIAIKMSGGDHRNLGILIGDFDADSEIEILTKMSYVQYPGDDLCHGYYNMMRWTGTTFASEFSNSYYVSGASHQYTGIWHQVQMDMDPQMEFLSIDYYEGNRTVFFRRWDYSGASLIQTSSMVLSTLVYNLLDFEIVNPDENALEVIIPMQIINGTRNILSICVFGNPYSIENFQFYDDFDDGNHNDWQVLQGSWDSSSYYLRSKGYNTWDDNRMYESKIAYNFSTPFQADGLNFSFRFRYESPFTSNIRGQNIIFRFYSDTYDHFRITLANEGDSNDYFLFSQDYNQTDAQIGSMVYFGDFDTNWHTGKVVVYKNELKFYYDGNQFLSVNDTSSQIENFQISSMVLEFSGWNPTADDRFRCVDDINLISKYDSANNVSFNDFLTGHWKLENNFKEERTQNALSVFGSGITFSQGIVDEFGLNLTRISYTEGGCVHGSFDFNNTHINRSISVWFKLINPEGGHIVSLGTVGGTASFMSIWVNENSTGFNGNWNDAGLNLPISKNVWHHMVVTYNINKHIQIYLDSNLILEDNLDTNNIIASDDITIGARWFSSKTENYFGGMIDDVRYYENFVLSQTNVNQIFQSTYVEELNNSSENNEYQITKNVFPYRSSINNFIYGTYSEKYGTVALYFNTTSNKMCIANSSDFQTWSNIQEISGAYSGIAQGSVIALQNGSLFALFESGSWPQTNNYYLQTNDMQSWSSIYQATNDNYFEGNPKFFALNNNRIGLTYYNGPYGTEDGVCRIYDNGIWSSPRRVYNQYLSPNVGAPVVFVNATGGWTMIFAKGDPSSLYITYSENEGLTWTTPYIFRTNIHPNSYAIYNFDGKYHLFYGTQTNNSILYESSLDFQSWSESKTIMTVSNWGLWSYALGPSNSVIIFHVNSTESNIFQMIFKNSSPSPPILNQISPKPSKTGNITLDWDDVVGASSYYIYRDINIITTIDGMTPIGNTNISIFDDIGLADGTYYYVVIASNAYGNSSISNLESVYIIKPPYGVEDHYENNDTPQTAWSFPNPLTPSQGDPDFFYITCSNNYSLRAFITFNGTLNDMRLEVWLRDSSRGLYQFIAANDTKNSSMENVYLNVTGNYDIIVGIFGEDNMASYNLDFEFFGMNEITDDLNEENDYISFAQNITGSCLQNLIQLDPDWYRLININNSGEYSVNLSTSIDSLYTFNLSIYQNNFTEIEYLSHYYFNSTLLSVKFELQPGSIYYILITGDNSGKNYQLEFQIFSNLIISVPITPVLQYIVPYPSITGNITLNWNDVDGATSYYVYRENTTITSTLGLIPIANPLTPNFNDNGLSNGTYYYVIVASNASGNSSLSNCENITVAILPPPSYVPFAPNLAPITPNPSTTGNITLSWNPIDGATSYYVYRETTTFTSTLGLTPIANPTTTTFQDLGLFNGTYYYAIVATNLSGNSTLSNIQSISITIPPPPSYVPFAPNLAPITPNPSATGNITLDWNDVDGATSYYVYRETTTITSTSGLIPIAHPTISTYQDLGLLNGTYHYAIVATNASGNSSLSNIRTITVALPPPPNFVPFAPTLSEIVPNPSTTGNITLFWTSVPGATQYRIYRDTIPINGIEGKIAIATVEETNYSDVGRTNGTYYYVVVAVNASGQSPLSNSCGVTVTIPPILNSNSTTPSTTSTSNPSPVQPPTNPFRVDGFSFILVLGIISMGIVSLYIRLRKSVLYN
jgi:hypothetical protein